MSAIGDNIRALRTLYGNGRDLTQNELAEIIGVTRETVNKWEAGSIGNIRTSNIERLCEHFDLSMDDLRSEIHGLAAQLRKQRESELLERISVKMPVSQFTVPLVKLDELRNVQELEQPLQKVEVTPSIINNHHALYGFKMKDESMGRILPKGCHVFVDLDAEPQARSLVVVSVPEVSEDLLVRRLYLGGTKAMLASEGYEDWEDIVLERSNLCVIGTVVWVQPPRELK